MDWLVASAGALAACAVCGALLVTGADLAERRFGLELTGPGLLALCWILGAALMAAPMAVLPAGVLAFFVARRRGVGGWLAAAGCGALMPVLRSGAAVQSREDALLWLAVGIWGGLCFWWILRLRLNPAAP